LQHESILSRQPKIKNGISHGQPDDLDLLNLIQKKIAFISRFKIILLIFFVIGLSAGLFLYFSSPKQYSTRLIVHPWFISNQDEIEIIDNWKNMLAKGEKEQLASLMNCNINVIKKLNSIGAEEILKTYVTNNPNGFLINVSVTDTSILDDLQSGIMYGLNNGPYIRDKIEIKRAKDKELIAKVNAEIEKLNTTKNFIDSMIRTRNGNSSSLLIDISRINAEWIDLNEKLLGYQEDLKFLSGIQILEGFHKGKPVRSGLLKFSVLGMAAGCFIGYMIALFLYILQKLKTAKSQLSLPS
jgi:hypothetical protein